MPRRKLNYQEGDWFSIRLPQGWAAGMVARMDGRGGVLGYFFLFDHAPRLADLAGLQASGADLVAHFGDLNLLDGQWPVLGQVPGWDRAAWPVPVFARGSEPEDWWVLVYLDDQLCEIREEKTTRAEAARHWRAWVLGASAVEIQLAKIARERARPMAPAA